MGAGLSTGSRTWKQAGCHHCTRPVYRCRASIILQSNGNPLYYHSECSPISRRNAEKLLMMNDQLLMK